MNVFGEIKAIAGISYIFFYLMPLSYANDLPDFLCQNEVHSTYRCLNLYAKNPTNWQITKDGAKGKIRFDLKTASFTLLAVGLIPHKEYSLVRYPGKPPNGDFIACANSDLNGNFKIIGRWNNWTAKIWLVPSEDIVVNGNNAKLISWHPEKYLFEAQELPR